MEQSLWYGHTYDNDDPIMSWVRVDEAGHPPEDLVNRRRDAEFENTVIDHPTRQVLVNKLRDAIHVCHKAWEDYERKMRLHVAFYYNKDKDEIERIKENLKKKKVILCDEKGTDYALEQTPADTLEYAKLQLDRETDYYFKNNEKAELVQPQKKIYVLAQFLVLPQILDKPISTKGRGITVALA
ncbi:hypothetical protein DPV78_002235 [Talaromyces pinophilus]|nr:hypothetical protein DPV78_002235 [Talaromyces pinophilus]